MNGLGWSGFEDCYFCVPKPTRIENTLLVVHKVTMELYYESIFGTGPHDYEIILEPGPEHFGTRPPLIPKCSHNHGGSDSKML